MTGGLVRLVCKNRQVYAAVTCDVMISPVGNTLGPVLLDLFIQKGPYTSTYAENTNTHLLLPLGAL